MQLKNPLVFGLMAVLLIGGTVLPAMSQTTEDVSQLELNLDKPVYDLNEKIISQSIIGSTFECFIEREIEESAKKMILPNIKGSAFITGEQILYKDDNDPFPQGYRLNDTWPL